jgi:adenosylcobinamide-GDP ribazoletransferase
MRYFPAVGLIVGFIGALVFAVTSFFFPKTLAVLVVDGGHALRHRRLPRGRLGDMVDGFGGGWGKERILEIMKDSRIGSYGAVALIMVLLTKFCALVEIDCC